MVPLKRLLLASAAAGALLTGAGGAGAQTVSSMTQATLPLTGSEYLFLVQGGLPRKIHPFDLAPASESGRFIMYPPANWRVDPTLPFTVLPPVGVTGFSCAGTQTMCLAEVLTSASRNGYSVDAYCPGENTLGQSGTSTTFPFFVLNAGIETGPMAQRYIWFHGCNLTFSTSVTGPGLMIDSMVDASVFRLDGQIVYQPASAGSTSTNVLLYPHTSLPTEQFVGMASSSIFIGAAAVQPQSGVIPAVITADLSLGGIVNMEVGGREINCNGSGAGALAHIGLLVKNATLNSAAVESRYSWNHIHQCDVAGVKYGDAQTSPAPYFNNHWDLTIKPNGDASTICFDTYGNSDWGTISCTTEEGPVGKAVKFEANTSANNFWIYTNGLSNPVYTDLGSSNNYNVDGTQIFNAALYANGGLTLNDGANSPVFLGKRSDDTTYSLLSLVGSADATSAGNIGLVGGKTGDVTLYLMVNGVTNGMDLRTTSFFPHTTGVMSLGLASPLHEFTNIYSQAATISGSLSAAAITGTSYTVGATPGADCAVAVPAHITVVKGIVTVCN